jgi:hypothetical protein
MPKKSTPAAAKEKPPIVDTAGAGGFRDVEDPRGRRATAEERQTATHQAPVAADQPRS